MNTVRLFQSGHCQAVRPPKEFRFNGTEVDVRHFGGALLLPKDKASASSLLPLQVTIKILVRANRQQHPFARIPLISQ